MLTLIKALLKLHMQLYYIFNGIIYQLDVVLDVVLSFILPLQK